MSKQPLFTLHETNDYNLFENYSYNRDIRSGNLKVIEASILKHGLKQPLLVSSDGHIIDGQHRFIALRKLNRPIWYIVNNSSGHEDVEIVNNDRADWVTKDRLKSQADKGNLDCNKVLELVEFWENEQRLPFMVVVDVYNSTRNGSSTLIKNKKYKIDEELGDYVVDSCIQLKEVFEDALSAKFVRALKKVIMRNRDIFDIDQLIKNAQKNKLRIYNKEGDIVEDIIEIYNKRLRANKIS